MSHQQIDVSRKMIGVAMYGMGVACLGLLFVTDLFERVSHSHILTAPLGEGMRRVQNFYV
jgi:hypothetical protein